MRKTCILAVALLLAAAAGAQNKKPVHRSALSIQGGVSSPMGSFRRDDVLDKGAGLAKKLGGTFKADFTYYIEKDFGLSANFLVNINTVIPEAAKAGLVPSESSNWQMIGVVAGPAFGRSFTDRLTGEFRMMGGLVNVNTPFMKYDGLNLVDDWQWSAALQASAQMRYRFSKRVYFLINADYLHTNPKFRLESPNVELTHKQDISALVGTAGLGIYFK